MTITVHGPGGVTVHFPDGTDPATIDQVMRQAAAPSGKGDFQGFAPGVTPHAVQPATPDRGAGDAFGVGLADSLSFGAGDEIAGAMSGALDWLGGGSFSEGYDRTSKRIRGDVATAQQQHPWWFGAGEVGGAVPSMIAAPEVTAFKAAANAGRLGRVGAAAGNAALTGAAYGAVTGAGHAEGGLPERLGGAAEGAAIGGAVGGALGAPLALGADVVASRAAARAAAPHAPDVVAAAERQGISIPVAAASDSLAVQKAGQAAKAAPLFGQRIVAAGRKTIEDSGKVAERIAADFGRGGVAADAAGAGSGARQALENFVGPMTKGFTDRAYADVDALVNPAIKTPLNETAKVATAILKRRQAATLKGPGGAVDLIRRAAASKDGLTFAGLKDLRTRIGEMLDGAPALIPGDMSQGELKLVYGALSKDLRTAADNAGGPAALNAFDRANRLYEAVSTRRRELLRILGAKNDEGVFSKIERMAGSTSTADIALLDKARRAMPPQAWNDVASAIVARMGRANGQGEFSLDRFFTGYNKMSPAGKKALFGGRKDLAAALDDLNTVASRFKAIQAFANPSGTAQVATGVVALTNPLIALKTIIPAHLLTRALSRPATVRAMANWAKVYDLAVRKPTKFTRQSIELVSRRLAREIGVQFGLGNAVDRLTIALQGDPSAVAGQSDQGDQP